MDGIFLTFYMYNMQAHTIFSTKDLFFHCARSLAEIAIFIVMHLLNVKMEFLQIGHDGPACVGLISAVQTLDMEKASFIAQVWA